jgi:hypothetical protein
LEHLVWENLTERWWQKKKRLILILYNIFKHHQTRQRISFLIFSSHGRYSMAFSQESTGKGCHTS